MDLFEFILIITSVIYAMGVAQILSGVSRLAQTDVPIRWYLPHSLWTFTLFVWIFLVWWSAWEFRDLNWTFPLYLYMALAPTLIFFACSLLIPQTIRDSSWTWKRTSTGFGDLLSVLSCWQRWRPCWMGQRLLTNHSAFRDASGMWF